MKNLSKSNLVSEPLSMLVNYEHVGSPPSYKLLHHRKQLGCHPQISTLNCWTCAVSTRRLFFRSICCLSTRKRLAGTLLCLGKKHKNGPSHQQDGDTNVG